jgi:transposase InsO family protein
MGRRGPGAHAIALWRLALIEEALDPTLTPRGRGLTVRRIARAPVRWPTGATRCVSVATLYRWIDAYEQGGLPALRPKPRKDRGKRRRRLPRDLVSEALRRLEEDPHQPLPFLVDVLEAHYRTQGREVRIPRSTLQRCLAASPGYDRVRQARKQTRDRRRFVAQEPHERWQMDGKGPFPVRLATGETVDAHVLSILDDATRAILAASAVPSPTMAAATAVVRQAARRWGLCESFYADRATIFDSHAFRAGMAELGVRRIPSRPGNAPARGKIEAYHRTISGSFAKRLATQVVVDFVHLQQLLDAVIHRYQHKRHRGLQQPPEEALAARTSSRTVPPARLVDAFREERRLTFHKVTGEIDLQGATWIVPGELRRRGERRVRFLLDPAAEAPPVVVDPRTGRALPLTRAAVRPGDAAPQPEPVRWGEGPLQTLYDAWRGQVRPQAEAGFGLPEIYALLTRAAGRHVPSSDAESAAVQRVWRAIGPLPRRATEKALAAIGDQLGAGRPIKAYLDALAARVGRAAPKPRRHS